MKPPRIPSVFKLGQRNQHKNFSYEPRTFDERKERLQKRKLEIEKELTSEQRLGQKYEEDLRERITDSWSQRETRRLQKNANRRLLLILAALFLMLYLIYQNFDLIL